MSDATDTTCTDFIRSLQAHDAAAWRLAFERLHPIAHRGARYANTRLSDEDMEEVINDALTDLAHQIGELQGWSQITAFVFVTAQRRSVDRLRQLRARKRHVESAIVVNVEEAPDELLTSDPRSLQRWAEVSSVMAELVDGLGHPASTLVRAHTQEGLSYEELARRHDMPLGTVAAIVYRSMRRLEREIGRSAKMSQELALYLRVLV